MKQSPIRMVAIDVDGTLLDPRGEVRPAVRAAVRAALAQGVIVTLATGRRFDEAAHIAADIGVEVPLVLHHGTLIQDSLTGEVLYEDALPPALMRAVVGALLAAGQQPILHCSPGSAHPVVSGPASHDNPATAIFLGREASVRRVSQSELPLTPHVLSVGAVHFDDVLRPVAQRLRDEPDCTVSLWEPGPLWSDYMLEVVHGACSKASALAHLAAQWGIGMHEVMAIGDEQNDVEMLAAVGLGVAMGNAVPAVQAVARAHVGTNDADGVAEALWRYILNTKSLT